jgi:hypothetical protein
MIHFILLEHNYHSHILYISLPTSLYRLSVAYDLFFIHALLFSQYMEESTKTVLASIVTTILNLFCILIHRGKRVIGQQLQVVCNLIVYPSGVVEPRIRSRFVVLTNTARTLICRNITTFKFLVPWHCSFLFPYFDF